MLTLDVNDPRDAKASGMLERDLIGWISTVDEHGRPRSVPVWFFWHDGRVMILSKPDTAKVRHLRAGSPVQFHLQAGGPFGDDVVILDGTADVTDGGTVAWMAEHATAYAAKYGEAMNDYGLSQRETAEVFSTLILITPTQVRAW